MAVFENVETELDCMFLERTSLSIFLGYSGFLLRQENSMNVMMLLLLLTHSG